MRKIFHSSMETFAIGGLNAGIFLYSIYLFMILLYALFNIKPFYHSGRIDFGLVDFEKGIPVNVSFHKKILPDTSIYSKSAKGSDEYTIDYESPYRDGRIPVNTALGAHTDTISAYYSVQPNLNSFPARGNDLIIKGVRVDEGLITIQVENKTLRLLFLLPKLLAGIITVCCMWQISGLLQSISTGITFHKFNLRRLQITGGLIIIYQITLFLLSTSNYFYLRATFTSSIPHFHSPVSLSASPNYDFSLIWLITGTSILIISSAFKKGIRLQLEQDLTI